MIVPDDKNWTWVLQRPCPDCGFDSSSVDFRDIPSLVRRDIPAWQAVLNRPDVSSRPDESTWSPLEYSAHVRDVFTIFSMRLDLVLTEDDPVFANWDQDDTAITMKYNEQDPVAVSEDLTSAGYLVADAFEAVPTRLLSRPARRSDGARFTIETLGRYFIHDPVHHLYDVL